MRFLHAADIHLDSPLRGLSAYEGAPVELLRTATRTAFTALVDAAIKESVDFVVIAGDLYDGDWRDFNTGLFFAREMGRLAKAAIPVFIVYGNHDAESEITKQLSLPANVTAFSARKPETHRIEHLRVALHGRSFREAKTNDNIVVEYPAAVPGWFNIGVLHTALEGHSEHATYAPCSLAHLAAKGYDYWALGHVHEHRVVSRDPYVVFPGNVQGRHIREPGARGAVLVTVDGGDISVERLTVDVLRWAHLHVDASAARTLEDVANAARREIEGALRQHAEGRPLAVRVTVEGRTAVHGTLFGLETQLRAEILAQASMLGSDAVWVEKVRLETRPEIDAATLKSRSDAIADLQAMLNRARTDTALLVDIATELKPLVDSVPKAVIDRVDALEAIRKGDVASLIAEIGPSLLARLATESGE